MSDKQVNLSKRLFKNTLNFGIGSLLPKVIGFFLIPVYTVYLSPQDFGIVDLTTSLGGFLLVTMRLGVTGSVTRFYYDHKEGESLKNYLTTIFWFLLTCSAVIGVVSWVTLDFSAERILPGLPVYPFVGMIIVWAFFNSNTDLQRRLLQVREQSAYSARLSIFTALLTISLTILFVVVFKLGAVGVVGATVVSSIIFFGQAQFYLRHDLRGKFDWSNLAPSISYSLGVLPYHLVYYAAPVINRSILAGYDSIAAVGILGIATRFGIPLNVFIGALQNSFTPMYFSIRKIEGDSEIGKKQIGELVLDIWGVGLLLLAAILCFGGLAIKILTTSEFHGAASLLPYVSISLIMGLAAFVFGNEIYYNKKTWWIAILSLVNVLINIIILIVLLPYLGLMAVAYALLISSVLAGALQIYVSRRIYRFHVPWRKFIISMVLMSILCVITIGSDNRFPVLIQGITSVVIFVIFVGLLFYFKLVRLSQIPFLNRFFHSK